MNWFEFALFVLLGWRVFFGGEAANKLALILFVVLMAMWLLLTLSGVNTHWSWRSP